jgi:hypothetical protein
MKNVKELRNKASKIITGLENGTLSDKNAQAMIRAMNVMVSSSKAQIDHYKMIGKKSKIDFLITT